MHGCPLTLMLVNVYIHNRDGGASLEVAKTLLARRESLAAVLVCYKQLLCEYRLWHCNTATLLRCTQSGDSMPHNCGQNYGMRWWIY
jgi:hypothetical protein